MTRTDLWRKALKTRPKALWLLLLCVTLVLNVFPAQGQKGRAVKSKGSKSRQSPASKNEFLVPCRTKVRASEVLVRFTKPVPISIVQLLVKKSTQYRTSRLKEVGTGSTLYLIHIPGLKVTDLLFLFNVQLKTKRHRLMDEGEFDIEYAEPNFILRPDNIPNDPELGRQWGLQDSGIGRGGISARSAWTTSTGSRDIVVGVVDSGVAYRHPDLVNNMWAAPREFTVHIGGKDITCPKGSHGFYAPAMSCDPINRGKHGTQASGIIGAEGNNNLGVVGVNWRTSIMALRYTGQSSSDGDIEDAVNAISFAVEVKKQSNLADIRVLNNSYGYLTTANPVCRPQSLADAIEKANAQGILFVASAGNDGKNTDDRTPHYPSGLGVPNIVSVAATTKKDKLAPFSNSGQLSVHLGAPGTGIFSTIPASDYAKDSGTSFAAPFVSGAAALILSKPGCERIGPTALRECLLSNADSVTSLQPFLPLGRRLNVKRAIDNCEKFVR